MVLKLVMHIADDKFVSLRTFFVHVNVFFEHFLMLICCINDINNILLANRSYSIYFYRNTQIFGKTQTQTLLKTQTEPVYTLKKCTGQCGCNSNPVATLPHAAVVLYATI